jgi:hypothetical protein
VGAVTDLASSGNTCLTHSGFLKQLLAEDPADAGA